MPPPQTKRHHRQQPPPYSPLSGDQLRPLKRFVEKEESAPEMVAFAEKLGGYLQSTRVTTSQIRNAYGNVKKMEMVGWSAATRRQLVLIKPRLAYAAGRHRGGLEELKKVLDVLIDAVDEEEKFQKFCQFFEAVLAYHKAYGGK